MRFRTHLLRTATLAALVTALAAVPMTPANADITSVAVSPVSWTRGSDQAFTLTLQISGSVTYVGFWDLTSPRTWTLNRTGSFSGTLSGNTLTCATTGVTYTSTMFATWGDGVKANACYDDQDGSYFEVGANIATAGASGPGTVVISIPAGFLTAPTSEGTSVFQAIANPDPKSNFDAVVAAASPIPTDAGPPAHHLQEVGMPVSGTCTQIVDDHLAWGTGLTGGWKPVWGAWLNGALGGPACSRTLVNVPGTQRWMIL